MAIKLESEERELLLKRLRHRSRQRGFAEADEIFIGFAANHLNELSDPLLAQYETLLALPDWDTFGWVSGQSEPEAAFAEIVAEIKKTLRV